MKIYEEISLRDFQFWSGAKETAEYLTLDDFDEIENYLESDYQEYTEVDINDFFWFEEDAIAAMLGYNDWDDFMHHRHPEEFEDEDENEDFNPEELYETEFLDSADLDYEPED